MSVAYFGRRYSFSAAHRLHTEALTAEENRAAYGKCNNPHGHGHNYTVEVLCGGPVGATTGMVINMAKLDEIVKRVVMERFDHMNLNLNAIFEKVVPTTENLSIALFDLLEPELTRENVRLEKIRIEETENNFFEYVGVK
jgi:6-pyruvoyltetrahydropterin/6-carboxytetrahydropterin synthase